MNNKELRLIYGDKKKKKRELSPKEKALKHCDHKIDKNNETLLRPTGEKNIYQCSVCKKFVDFSKTHKDVKNASEELINAIHCILASTKMSVEGKEAVFELLDGIKSIPSIYKAQVLYKLNNSEDRNEYYSGNREMHLSTSNNDSLGFDLSSSVYSKKKNHNNAKKHKKGGKTLQDYWGR